MNTEQRMNSLWTETGGAHGGVSMHMLRLGARGFIPSRNRCQRIDRKDHSGVIPLRATSYQLSTILNYKKDNA
jgi:hypothetical protein